MVLECVYMALSKEEVKHIAKLGRLSLTDAEIEQYGSDLNGILTYIETLNELDTEGVEPMVGAVELKNVMRADECQPTAAEERAAMLANAPDSEETFVKVPQMS